MKNKFAALLLLLAFLAGALLVGSWEYKFHPDNRVELVNPVSKNRAFTHACGFGDISIILRASDWPHTFTKPAMLGDIFSERHAVHHLHWSNDGSVIALRTKQSDEEAELFSSAYDFTRHSLIQQFQSASSSDCNALISQLLEERGGVGPVLTGIDDGKYTEYTAKFPAWGLLAPVLITTTGLIVAGKIWRRKS